MAGKLLWKTICGLFNFGKEAGISFCLVNLNITGEPKARLIALDRVLTILTRLYPRSFCLTMITEIGGTYRSYTRMI